MPPLPVTIAGLGSYLPAHVVTNAELELEMNLPPGWIEQTTGVRERRYALGETSVSMAVVAAQRALAAAGCDLADLDLIIGASSGPSDRRRDCPLCADLQQRDQYALA